MQDQVNKEPVTQLGDHWQPLVMREKFNSPNGWQVVTGS